MPSRGNDKDARGVASAEWDTVRHRRHADPAYEERQVVTDVRYFAFLTTTQIIHQLIIQAGMADHSTPVQLPDPDSLDLSGDSMQ